MIKKGGVFKSLDGLTDNQVKQMINWQSETGLTPLHVTVRNTNFGHVQKLVSLGADCSLPDAEGNTPLHLAAECGNLEILTFLAESTDDLDLQNNDGETPVILAAHAGHIGAFVALTSMAKHVVPADTSIVDAKGRNILMHACISGDMDLVRLILANREGNSQHLSISRLSVNAEDASGCTALMHCAMEGQWHLIAILVANKANITSEDKKGRTALHWASASGDASTVSALIDCGAVIDDPDADFWTPLMHAVKEDNLDIAQLLIECHANPDHCVGLTRSRAMHLMLCDAVRDSLVDRAFYPKRQKPLIVDGRLVITLIRVDDVYIDPSSVVDGTDDLIVYGVIQWKSSGHADDNQIIYITDGVKADRSIVWNASASFFLKEKEISKDCLLCIDLFATRNHEPISELFNMEHAAGEDDGNEDDAEQRHAAMDFKHKQIQDYERKILGINQTEKEAKSALAEFNFSDHKRRWNQLRESRKRLTKYYDIHFPLPPVPTTHFPCGSVQLSFSRLRELFRPGPKRAIQFSRFPRFADKGEIFFELDFVPSIVVHRELRKEYEIPTTPKANEVGPVLLPDDFFEDPKPSVETADRFATRTEKLAIQSRMHYVRWWASLGDPSKGQKKDESGKPQKRSFKQEEEDLMKIINIIARSMIN
jgi:ankyrin repeat protein